ncbi:MAG: NfeD family protein [Clostridia bacterium]|nr:NfeD family protein [Clostridia bacterium]
MTIFWVVAIIVFLVVEALTAGLASIWFAIGALAALISALFNAPIWLQIVWFFIVSIIALIATRPLVKRFVNSKSQPTNADMLLGTEGIVTEPIDNIAGTGAVAISGKVWTARSTGGSPIALSTTVTADRIEGVKLFVSPAVDKTVAAEKITEE